MKKSNLILFGSGGHAHSCIDVIECQGDFDIAGFVAPEEGFQNEFMGYPILGVDSDIPELVKQFENALITVGQIKSAQVRMRIFEQASASGFKFPTIISPNAYVSRHAKLGDGTIVMNGAIVNAGATVGKNCIVNTNALIEHDAIIEDHCHISTGALVNGEVIIGSSSFVGSGSVIKQGIKLGKGCIVGMGLSVRYDYAENSKILTNTK